MRSCFFSLLITVSHASNSCNELVAFTCICFAEVNAMQAVFQSTETTIFSRKRLVLEPYLHDKLPTQRIDFVEMIYYMFDPNRSTTEAVYEPVNCTCLICTLFTSPG